ncbi:transposase [Patescibacteria group bacterium]
MRKDKISVGDFVHVLNRGNRKQEIVRDVRDRFSFFQMLFYFNDEYSIDIPMRRIKQLVGDSALIRPDGWPPANPLVKIHAVILKENHYHMLLEEISDGGIARFMHRIGIGMTKRFNAKYDEVGSLFQGAYKIFKLDKDGLLEYVNMYIHIKNAFEMYPGGIKNALKNFDDAYEFAIKCIDSSLGVYIDGKENHPLGEIVSTDVLGDIFEKDEKWFKKYAREYLEETANE